MFAPPSDQSQYTQRFVISKINTKGPHSVLGTKFLLQNFTYGLQFVFHFMSELFLFKITQQTLEFELPVM